jgi:small subunit ribosomal protein S2
VLEGKAQSAAITSKDEFVEEAVVEPEVKAEAEVVVVAEVAAEAPKADEAV